MWSGDGGACGESLDPLLGSSVLLASRSARQQGATGPPGATVPRSLFLNSSLGLDGQMTTAMEENTDALYESFLTFDNHQTRTDTAWKRGDPSTWFANKTGFLGRKRTLPVLVKSWDVKEPFIIDGEFLDLLRTNIGLVHETLKGGNRARNAGSEAVQCSRAIQALGDLGQHKLKVSPGWKVSVVDGEENAAPLSAFDIGLYFTNRPYLLRSKDLYECQQMPWWKRGRDDSVCFLRDCVIPNPYEPFKETLGCKKFTEELQRPPGWNYPEDLKTSLWYQTAGPWYQIKDGGDCQKGKLPAGIPEPTLESWKIEKVARPLKESDFVSIPRPVLVEAPVDHFDFEIKPVELKLLGYELKKLQTRAWCAYTNGINLGCKKPPNDNPCAMLYEAVAIGDAGATCMEAGENNMSLRVPGANGMFYWTRDKEEVAQLSPNFYAAAILLWRRKWLIWLPDMTLRLAANKLATLRSRSFSMVRLA